MAVVAIAAAFERLARTQAADVVEGEVGAPPVALALYRAGSNYP
jgi:hypothetical protein